MNKLSGRKTYLIAAGVLAVGMGQFAMGEITLVETVNYILSGLGLAALRAGVSKS